MNAAETAESKVQAQHAAQIALRRCGVVSASFCVARRRCPASRQAEKLPPKVDGLTMFDGLTLQEKKNVEEAQHPEMTFLLLVS